MIEEKRRVRPDQVGGWSSLKSTASNQRDRAHAKLNT